MTPKVSNHDQLHRSRIALLLHQLGIPCHRAGFRQLCIAIDQYARTENISLSKELYPFIASRMQLSDYRAVEHSIRQAIHQGWEHRNPEVWNQYFPDDSKCPSNKVFLAVLSEFL